MGLKLVVFAQSVLGGRRARESPAASSGSVPPSHCLNFYSWVISSFPFTSVMHWVARRGYRREAEACCCCWWWWGGGVGGVGGGLVGLLVGGLVVRFKWIALGLVVPSPKAL